MDEVIVAGALWVAPDDRDAYLAGCAEVVEAARAAPGCVDFHLGADLLDAGRVNVFEHWSSTEAVDAFRGSGPSGDQQARILDARVVQHRVTAAEPL